MSRTDLIADGLTMIRNALMAKKENVDIPASKMLSAILEILKKSGYIDNFKFLDDKKQGQLRVYLRYKGSKPAIRTIKRVSRPGLRVYAKYDEIPHVLRGKGIAIVSTSKGIVLGHEARKQHIGGEILAYIW